MFKNNRNLEEQAEKGSVVDDEEVVEVEEDEDLGDEHIEEYVLDEDDEDEDEAEFVTPRPNQTS